MVTGTQQLAPGKFCKLRISCMRRSARAQHSQCFRIAIHHCIIKIDNYQTAGN